jgi:hypothetical protein
MPSASFGLTEDFWNNHHQNVRYPARTVLINLIHLIKGKPAATFSFAFYTAVAA